MKPVRSLLLAMLSAVGCTLPAMAQFDPNAIGTITFVPAAPRAYEPLHAHFKAANNCYLAEDELQFVDGTFVLIAGNQVCPIPTPDPPVEVDLVMGRLPAGEWTVEIRSSLNGPARGTFSVTVAPADWIAFSECCFGNALDVSGVWGIAGRAGSGLTLTQSASGALAGLLFTYAANGAPEWTTLQSSERFEFGVWAGDVYRTIGAPWTAPASSSAPTYARVNRASLVFPSAMLGELCLYAPDTDFTRPPYPAPLRCERLERYPFN